MRDRHGIVPLWRIGNIAGSISGNLQIAAGKFVGIGKAGLLSRCGADPYSLRDTLDGPLDDPSSIETDSDTSDSK